MHRNCTAFEIQPEYCAATLQRFFDITKIEPERVAVATPL